MTVSIALIQPDIPQNTGTILRLGACLGLDVHVIGPAGFDLGERALRRAGLDYAPRARLVRHLDFDTFCENQDGRIVLLSTRGEVSVYDFAFRDKDVLMFGSESSGAPEAAHARADAVLRIPLVDGMRSLNVAVCAAMVAGEALRQTGGFGG